jgi:exodeoxyribonuclease-1
MAQFHGAHWEQKVALARNFQDQRYLRLALRLIYFERPDLMSVDLRQTWQTELHNRLMTPVEAESRWRSIPAARQEAERLIATMLGGDQLTRQRQFLHYLDAQVRRIALTNVA